MHQLPSSGSEVFRAGALCGSGAVSMGCGPMAKGSGLTQTPVLKHPCRGAGHGNSVELQTQGLANPGTCVPVPTQMTPIPACLSPAFLPLPVNGVDNVTQLSLQFSVMS